MSDTFGGYGYSYDSGYEPTHYLDDALNSSNASYSFMAPSNYSQYSASGYGGGSSMGSMENYANMGGALYGGYQNASTDSTGSVLGGAASGAMAGASFGPVGMVVGGVLGAISGYFGSKGKKKQQKKAFEQQKELAVAQIQEQEKNYQTHQKQLGDALGKYSDAQPYEYQNALLAPMKKQQNVGFNQPAPAQQGPQGILNPQDVMQFRQNQLSNGLNMYSGMQYG